MGRVFASSAGMNTCTFMESVPDTPACGGRALDGEPVSLGIVLERC